MRRKIKAVKKTSASNKESGLRKMIGKSSSKKNKASNRPQTLSIADFGLSGGSNPNNLPLPELLIRYRQSGDSTLASILYHQFGHLVLGSSIRYLEDVEMAKDAAMEIFQKVLLKLMQETPNHFPAWLYTVTKHHCLEILRKNLKMPKRQGIETIMALPDRSEDFNAQLEDRTLCAERVRRALQTLPEQQRECVELFYIHELSYKEVAEETGFTLNAVKSHIQNGKRKLVMLLGSTRGGHVTDREAL